MTDRHIGRVLRGTYRLERLIGRGGMGGVYEASHLRLARRFAVKLLAPGFARQKTTVARFKREALVTSALGHPHIVEVTDFDHSEEGWPFLVMELLKGEDLGTRLERVGRMGWRDVARIFRDAASALHATHERGIVHRDLKPHNIFLCRKEDRDDFVKILDFGISKIVDAGSELTEVGTAMGTPCYISPEMANRQARDVDHRTDIYSMGLTLYQMLSGDCPFRGSLDTVIKEILDSQAPPLDTLSPEIPTTLSAVIQTAMAPRREDRFPSMRAFWDAFRASLPPDGQDVPVGLTSWEGPSAPLYDSDHGSDPDTLVTPPDEVETVISPDGTAPPSGGGDAGVVPLFDEQPTAVAPDRVSPDPGSAGDAGSALFRAQPTVVDADGERPAPGPASALLHQLPTVIKPGTAQPAALPGLTGETNLLGMAMDTARPTSDTKLFDSEAVGTAPPPGRARTRWVGPAAVAAVLFAGGWLFVRWLTAPEPPPPAAERVVTPPPLHPQDTPRGTVVRLVKPPDAGRPVADSRLMSATASPDKTRETLAPGSDRHVGHVKAKPRRRPGRKRARRARNTARPPAAAKALPEDWIIDPVIE